MVWVTQIQVSELEIPVGDRYVACTLVPVPGASVLVDQTLLLQDRARGPVEVLVRFVFGATVSACYDRLDRIRAYNDEKSGDIGEQKPKHVERAVKCAAYFLLSEISFGSYL